MVEGPNVDHVGVPELPEAAHESSRRPTEPLAAAGSRRRLAPGGQPSAIGLNSAQLAKADAQVGVRVLRRRAGTSADNRRERGHGEQSALPSES